MTRGGGGVMRCAVPSTAPASYDERVTLVILQRGMRPQNKTKIIVITIIIIMTIIIIKIIKIIEIIEIIKMKIINNNKNN